jgi:hypothetical protein
MTKPLKVDVFQRLRSIMGGCVMLFDDSEFQGGIDKTSLNQLSLFVLLISFYYVGILFLC